VAEIPALVAVAFACVLEPVWTKVFADPEFRTFPVFQTGAGGLAAKAEHAQNKSAAIDMLVAFGKLPDGIGTDAPP
jgi:hypothetical protein